MSEKSPDVILEKIEALRREVRDGFKGVHDRQNIANGNIKKHEKSINDLEKADIKIASSVRSYKIFWIVLTTLITIIVALLGKYVY